MSELELDITEFIAITAYENPGKTINLREGHARELLRKMMQAEHGERRNALKNLLDKGDIVRWFNDAKLELFDCPLTCEPDEKKIIVNE